MNESQRRAFAALGIGPLWRLRSASSRPGEGRAPAGDARLHSGDGSRADDPGPCLYALSDAGGDWLFVVEADSTLSGGERGAVLQPDAMRLLDRMLAALGLNPGPRSDAFAERIDVAAPRVVVALGAGAARALLRLGDDAPLAALRGRVHEWRIGERKIPLVVSMHPSQLLEAPQEKAAAWADLCLGSGLAK